MAALLVGKALVQGNPKVQNNLWKPEVIKPFPSQYLKPKNLTKITGETGKPLGSVIDLFTTSGTTLFTRSSFGITQKKGFSDRPERYERSERSERHERPERPARLSNVPVLTLEHIDIESLKFEAFETSPKGNFFVPVTLNGKNIRVETPILRAPFGVKKFQNANGREDAALTLAFELNSSDPSNKMLTFLQALEEKVVKHTAENAESLFPHLTDKSPEHIQTIFRSGLRPPKDPKFSPLWRLKIPMGNRPAEFFYKEDKIPIEEVVNHTRLTSVVEMKGIWVLPEAFGISWVLLQSKVEEIPARRAKRQEGEVNESQ